MAHLERLLDLCKQRLPRGRGEESSTLEHSTVSLLYHGPHFALGLASSLGLPLVIEFFAFGQCQLDFDAAVLEVHFCRNYGETLLLRAAGKPVDFGSVHQQFSRASGLMVFAVAMTIRANVSIHEPDFSTAYGSVAVFEITTAFPDRFHFGSGKHNSALMRLQNKIVVVSLSIGRHHFFVTHSITIMMAPPNSIGQARRSRFG